MPSITPIFATNFANQTGDEDVYTDTGCETSVLSAGVPYMVIYGLMVRNYTDTDYQAEARLMNGATEISSIRAQESQLGGPAGAYGGYPFVGVLRLTGDGVSTLRFQRRRLGGLPGDQVHVNGQYIYAVPLSGFTENADYFYGENSLPLITTMGVGFEALASQTFTAASTGSHPVMLSYQYDSTSGPDQLNARLTLVEDPSGAATATTLRGGSLIRRTTSGADILTGRMIGLASLTQGTEYRIDLEVNASVDGSVVDQVRSFVFTSSSLGDGTTPGVVYADSTVGFTVIGETESSGNALITAAAPTAGSSRNWLILGDLTKKISDWSRERIEVDPEGVGNRLHPISGFGPEAFGTGGGNDLLNSPTFAYRVLSEFDSDTSFTNNSEGLGPAANNLLGYDEASGTGTTAGDAILGLWLYSPDPLLVLNGGTSIRFRDRGDSVL